MISNTGGKQVTIKIKDLCRQLEKLAPKYMAESWDNVGLLVGDEEKEVKRIMLALDATPDVIDEAVNNKIDLIITHHPLIFKGLKQVNNKSVLGKSILKMIQNNVALYSAHTNLDMASGGTNDAIASLLGLEHVKVLKAEGFNYYKKLVVYVPATHSQQVADAMCKAGAGHIGNYSHCTFNTKGIGTFQPLEGTDPFIGEQGKVENVEEIRIETIVRSAEVGHIINEMIKAHPYEEVAYDIYALDKKDMAYGIGRTGQLVEEMTLESFATFVKDKLGLEYIQYIGHKNKKVKTIAFCTGSAIQYMKDAKKHKADVYMTGDIKYHDAQDALFEGINLINASHFGTEVLVLPFLKDYLGKHFEKLDIMMTTKEKDPFTTL